MWRIDRTLPLPLYRQLVRIVEEAVLTGKLAPGERLPPERALAALACVNRSTVVQALDELAEREVIVRRRGSGTFVNPRKWGVCTHARPLWRRAAFAWPHAAGKTGAGRSGGSSGGLEAETEALRQRALAGEAGVFDLSGDELAPDLLPSMNVPRHFWDEAVRAEQGNEAVRLGLRPFREAVRRFLADTHGLDAPLKNVLITSGLRQTVFLITQCMLKPGDAVAVEAPSYFYALPVFQAAGLRLYALPMDEHGAVPKGLERLLDSRPVKMVFLNPAFQNPTGTVMPDARKRAVLAVCTRALVPVMEDDAYGALAFLGAPPAPLKLHDQNGQVLYAGSLSGLAGSGIRAGWLVAPEHTVNTLADARLMMDAGLSALPQILAAEYLERAAPTHIPWLRSKLRSRALALAAFLRERVDAPLELAVPQGGLYLYATVPHEPHEARPGEPGRNASGVEKARREAHMALLRAGVIPAPGTLFGDERAAFRLNCSMFEAT